MLKVFVDREKCIGCGMCSTICLEIFEMSPAGEVHVKEEYREEDTSKGEVPNKRVRVFDAEDSCPVDAIKVKTQKS